MGDPPGGLSCSTALSPPSRVAHGASHFSVVGALDGAVEALLCAVDRHIEDKCDAAVQTSLDCFRGGRDATVTRSLSIATHRTRGSPDGAVKRKLKPGSQVFLRFPPSLGRPRHLRERVAVPTLRCRD
jgi:hypothetical protein